jgi:hypothetical protein
MNLYLEKLFRCGSWITLVHTRRGYLVTTGALAVYGLTGCVSSGSSDAEDSPESATVAVRNRFEEEVTVDISIKTAEGDERFAETFRVDSGTTERSDSFLPSPGEYQITVSRQPEGKTERRFWIRDSYDPEHDQPIHVTVYEDGELSVRAPGLIETEGSTKNTLDPDAIPDIHIRNSQDSSQEVSVELVDTTAGETLHSETMILAGGQGHEVDVEAGGELELRVETPDHGQETFELDGEIVTRPGFSFDVDIHWAEIDGSLTGV